MNAWIIKFLGGIFHLESIFVFSYRQWSVYASIYAFCLSSCANFVFWWYFVFVTLWFFILLLTAVSEETNFDEF